LAMAKIMLFPRNVLVLDEPTNHLDIPARETLEQALHDYEGTLVVISHDRYFLDRVTTRLLVISGTQVESHLGNYSDWRRRRRESEAQPQSHARAQSGKLEKRETEKRIPARAAEIATTPAGPAAAEAGAARAASKEKERERRRLERRVETLEGDVAKLEAELAEVRAALASDHGGDWQKLHTLADRERQLDELLARRMSEWETASAALTQAG
jgi:ATP-binding cassette, subfamily F, member 3